MHKQFEHGASTSNSYITHAFVHGRRSGGYTFEVCKRDGSGSMGHSGSRLSRDGRGSSGTRLGEGLDAFEVFEGDGRGTWR